MKQDQKRKATYTGYGIILGAAIGPLIWNLLFEDAYATGIGVGVGLGIVLGAIADSLGHVPWYSLSGIGLGTACGPILGVVLGLAHGAFLVSRGQTPVGDFFGLPYVQEYLGLCIIFCAASGMVLGTVVEVNQDKVREQLQDS